MWCPECNISGGCYCHTVIKYQPIDHEKELERWLSDLDIDNTYEINVGKEHNKQLKPKQ